ncbi:MAG: prolyl oligopeptidase family serine peptidase [Victivallales bacterium]|nr:prolyl oligopeptidase family serine peptidase [Victivallales bacterium]
MKPAKPSTMTNVLAVVAILVVVSAFAFHAFFKPAPWADIPEKVSLLQKIAQQQYLWAIADNSPRARRASWLMAKAQYAIAKAAPLKKKQPLDDKTIQVIREYYDILLLACHQNANGVEAIREEKGARLRAYLSPVDQSFQTYSVAVPDCYDPAVAWPLIVSMHGHGWFAAFQGHPAPAYKGAIVLSPRGRGSTDYKELGEDDVLAAIAEVKRDFHIDDDRVYLTGSSMGGTGAFHLGVHYADQFAAINPICGNADYLAWTERWGWNRRFPGRFDDMRKAVQEMQTARNYTENLLNLPAYIIHGSGDTVVPPAHSRNMVEVLRKYHANVQYREYPNAGHGGFPQSAKDDALSWTCSWKRNPAPSRIFWKADQLKHGKAWWLRMEQFARPLAPGYLSASVTNGKLTVSTSNMLSFSFQRPSALFSNAPSMTITVDGKELNLPNLPADPNAWIALRKSPVHGWGEASLLPAPSLIKKRGLEGPVSEALNAPFLVVIGTASESEEMKNAWMEEAKRFCAEWKRRNGAPCPSVLDTQCTPEQMERFNLLLFGGFGDNAISSVLSKSIPLSDVMANLPIKNDDLLNNRLNAPDIGSFLVYPNVEYAPERLVVMLSANSTEAAFQMWGRFGNWFNWGVYDSYKYFDYAVFDASSATPETMLITGWFGTDWQVESGKFFLGSEEVRATVAPQCHPPFEMPPNASQLLLAELKPVKIDQMRGAVGFGRGFFGEKFEEPGVIGMRAPCNLQYDITGEQGLGFETFTSRVTLVNPPEANMCLSRQNGEAVTFTLLGDGKPLQHRTVTWKHPVATFYVNVKGVKKLTLDAKPTSGPSWLHMGSAWLTPTLWNGHAPDELQRDANNDEPWQTEYDARQKAAKQKAEQEKLLKAKQQALAEKK